jgi:hypothetical protein
MIYTGPVVKGVVGLGSLHMHACMHDPHIYYRLYNHAILHIYIYMYITLGKFNVIYKIERET